MTSAEEIMGCCGVPFSARTACLADSHGNIQSLVLDSIYADKQARPVSVDSAAIIEVLRNVYDAQPLVDELLSAK
jgi:hypothetical protein